MKSKRGAFTLVEVLLVVALAGVIFIAAMGPLIFITGRLQAVVREYGVQMKVRGAMNALMTDVMSASTGSPQVRVIHLVDLEKWEDDMLVIWSVGPVRRGGQLCTVVYRVIREDLRKKVATGLYRWELPRESASNLRPDDLKTEDARLVLAGADSLTVKVLDGTNWIDTYSGAVPAAVRITITRDKRTYTDDEWMPKLRD